MRRMLMVGLVALGSLGAGAGFAQTTDNGTAPSSASRVTANVVIASGGLNSTSTPTSPLRIFRDGVPSVCGSTKAYPGDNPTPGGYAYQTVGYTNSGPARCVTFTFSGTCTGGGNPAGVFLAAYNGAFVPTSLSTNYIGDTGSSPVGGSTVTMGLNLAQNQSINLVIEQVNPAATSPASTCNFTLLDDRQILLPTMSPVALAAMAGFLALLGFFFMRRRAGQR